MKTINHRGIVVSIFAAGFAVFLIGAAFTFPPSPVRSWLTTNFSSGTFLNGNVPTWNTATKQWNPGTGGGGSITTNGSQFLGVPLSIKDGAVLTNLVTWVSIAVHDSFIDHFGSLGSAGQVLSSLGPTGTGWSNAPVTTNFDGIIVTNKLWLGTKGNENLPLQKPGTMFVEEYIGGTVEVVNNNNSPVFGNGNFILGASMSQVGLFAWEQGPFAADIAVWDESLPGPSTPGFSFAGGAMKVTATEFPIAPLSASFSVNVLPSVDNSVSLGSQALRWKQFHVMHLTNYAETGSTAFPFSSLDTNKNQTWGISTNGTLRSGTNDNGLSISNSPTPGFGSITVSNRAPMLTFNGANGTVAVGGNAGSQAFEVFGGNLQIPAGNVFQFAGRSRMASSADGIETLGNTLLNGFIRTIFGTNSTASGYPTMAPSISITNKSDLFFTDQAGVIQPSNTIASASHVFTANTACPTPSLAFAGAQLFSDGTNLIVTFQNAGGTRTTNKLTMTAWP